ncbi:MULTISPECIES: DpnD/PcfM family protein [unclassified Clostridium]|uniref:DpnD/PcfM family protein n=1 Tax=Clostridium TaxID=1485 RepID=UPI001C8BCC15|nr:MULTISPECIES: DpnD/PcfM family protein [unclassified Clostridium]MBX9138870.1 DpnD protein [Clostridium sp. K12(2020)]MBX9145636.1 DpnD protein [Clostridium sp. K13]
MEEYKFDIEEVLNRKVTVEATNIDEAFRIVNKLYRDEEIVLDYNDFTEYKIKYIDK